MRQLSLLLLVAAACLAAADPVDQPPIVIVVDAEFGDKTSTSATAIRIGAEAAAAEANRAGGLPGGRRLLIETSDNRSVPARAADNAQAAIARPEVVAILTGKFSPAVLAQVPLVQARGPVLVSAWSAAEDIIQHRHTPSWTFRVAMRDAAAVPRLLAAAGTAKIGLLLPNNAWGRSCDLAARAATAYAAVVASEWFAYTGDIAGPARNLVSAGAEVLVVACNEPHGAALVQAMAGWPAQDRRPILFHQGVMGGDFHRLSGDALAGLDVAVVTTFTMGDPGGERLVDAIRGAGHSGPLAAFPSVMGVAQGYDAVLMLVAAMRQAGSADRAAVRTALERLPAIDGALGRHEQPFTAGRHEGLDGRPLGIARWQPDGSLVRIEGR